MAPIKLSLAGTLAGLLILGGCSRSTESDRKNAAQERAAAPAAQSKPETPTYKVRFETSKGPVTVEVHPDWAPLGAQRFRELVEAKYYDGNRFFRVVPNFVVQFGLNPSPAVTKKWDKAFKDDEVKRSNTMGTLAFATMGPETRTTQIFINLKTNTNLDNQGFAPFAKVTDGIEVVQKFYAGYGERPDQDKITKQGNAYLAGSFPELDYIKTARIAE